MTTFFAFCLRDRKCFFVRDDFYFFWFLKCFYYWLADIFFRVSTAASHDCLVVFLYGAHQAFAFRAELHVELVGGLFKKLVPLAQDPRIQANQ